MKNVQEVYFIKSFCFAYRQRLAGTIRRYYDPDKTDKTDYRSIIKKKIIDEWHFK